jgi:hypothetical protein
MERQMKATITKDTLNRLYHIGMFTKIMYLERNVRLSACSDTFRYGTTLKDLDDDFKIPIQNLPLFISLVETAMGKNETVDIEYDVTEKEFGLETKKLYTVNIISQTQSTKFYSAEIEEFETITPKDTKDKSKVSESKLPASHMRFNLSSETLKMMDKNCKVLGADTIMFKANDDKPIKCKIYCSNIPDTPVSEFKIDNISTVNGDEFPLAVQLFNIIDKSLDYSIVINCEKNAILFANEEHGTFYITARKKLNN